MYEKKMGLFWTTLLSLIRKLIKIGTLIEKCRVKNRKNILKFKKKKKTVKIQ